RAHGLPEQPRRAEHTARTAAPVAGSGRDHGAVDGRLEKPKSETADNHPPRHFLKIRPLRQKREGDETDRKDTESDGAEQTCGITVGEAAGDRRGDGDRERPRRDDEPRLYSSVAEFLLQVKRQRHERQHLRRERTDGGADGKAEDRNAKEIDREKRYCAREFAAHEQIAKDRR